MSLFGLGPANLESLSLFFKELGHVHNYEAHVHPQCNEQNNESHWKSANMNGKSLENIESQSKLRENEYKTTKMRVPQLIPIPSENMFSIIRITGLAWVGTLGVLLSEITAIHVKLNANSICWIIFCWGAFFRKYCFPTQGWPKNPSNIAMSVKYYIGASDEQITQNTTIFNVEPNGTSPGT